MSNAHPLPLMKANKQTKMNTNEIKAEYAALIDEMVSAGDIEIGSKARCGKQQYTTILAVMLAKTGVLPPERIADAAEVLSALPANASAMRQEWERWGESSSPTAANNLAAKWMNKTIGGA